MFISAHSVSPRVYDPVTLSLRQLIVMGGCGDANHLPHGLGMTDKQRKGLESHDPFRRLPQSLMTSL